MPPRAIKTPMFTPATSTDHRARTRAILPFLALTLAATMVFGMRAEANVCVRNGSDQRLVFVAESSSGSRAVRWLAPGERLCAAGLGGGHVGAFATLDAVEGCSRLARDGEVETLLAYADFDRCAWGEAARYITPRHRRDSGN